MYRGYTIHFLLHHAMLMLDWPCNSLKLGQLFLDIWIFEIVVKRQRFSIDWLRGYETLLSFSKYILFGISIDCVFDYLLLIDCSSSTSIPKMEELDYKGIANEILLKLDQAKTIERKSTIRFLTTCVVLNSCTMLAT